MIFLIVVLCHVVGTSYYILARAEELYEIDHISADEGSAEENGDDMSGNEGQYA